jgi:hypothetical protein
MDKTTSLAFLLMMILLPAHGQSRLVIAPPWHDGSNSVAAALSGTVYDTLAFEFGTMIGFTLIETAGKPGSEQDLFRFARDEKLDFIVFGRLDNAGGQYRLNISLYDHENRAITANKTVSVARMNDIFQVTDRMFALLLSDINKTGTDTAEPEGIDPALLFGGGSGSEKDPFVISRPSHLINIDMYPLAHYKITSDIDLTGINWVPVAVFNGKLDGSGHTVKGLTIPGGLYRNGALFGMIAPGSEVRDLILEGVHVRSKGMGGSVCAVNLGRIVGCRATGTVDGAYSTGGLVGYNGGVLEGCLFEGDVTGRLNSIGGLCGHNEKAGEIVRCRFSGTVSNDGVIANREEYPKEVLKYPGSGLGGIAGTSHGLISQCAADAFVDCLQDTAGGITGHNMGIIENCRFSGMVKAGGRLAGLLVAYNEKGTLRFCFGRGKVECQSMGGGISGLNTGPLSDCVVFRPDISGMDSAGSLRLSGKGPAVRYHIIEEETVLTDTARQEYAGWDFRTVWLMTARGPQLIQEP